MICNVWFNLWNLNMLWTAGRSGFLSCRCTWMHPIDLANKYRSCNQERLPVPAPPCGTLCPAVHSMWCSQVSPTLKRTNCTKHCKASEEGRNWKTASLWFFFQLSMLYFLLILLPSLLSRWVCQYRKVSVKQPSSSRWQPNPTGEMKSPVSPSARRLPLSL